MGLYVVNGNVDEFRQGEVVDIEPELWQSYIDAGWLQPVDEDGNRIVALTADWAFTDDADSEGVEWSEPAGAEDGAPVDPDGAGAADTT